MGKFSNLVNHLEAKGLPASEAGGIAYKQGVKKNGKKAMAEGAAKGKPAATFRPKGMK